MSRLEEKNIMHRLHRPIFDPSKKHTQGHLNVVEPNLFFTYFRIFMLWVLGETLHGYRREVVRLHTVTSASASY